MAEKKKLTKKQEKAIQLICDLKSELSRIMNTWKQPSDYGIGFDEFRNWKIKAVDSISKWINTDEGKNLEETNVEYYESLQWITDLAWKHQLFLNKLIEKIEGQSNDFLNDLEEETKKNEDKNFVFISYANDDGDFAQLLKSKLEKVGIDAWIDEDQLRIGFDWRQGIDDAIRKSSALIVVMTPQAKKSEYVTYEWEFAFRAGIKVVPIMLKDVKLHPRLELLQYLDFTNRRARPLSKLIEVLKSNEKQTQGSKK
jgi:hypothetical protein